MKILLKTAYPVIRIISELKMEVLVFVKICIMMMEIMNYANLVIILALLVMALIKISAWHAIQPKIDYLIIMYASVSKGLTIMESWFVLNVTIVVYHAHLVWGIINVTLVKIV